VTRVAPATDLATDRLEAPVAASRRGRQKESVRVVDPNAGGSLRPVTVLFADIRGFTHLTELLPAEKLARAINDCFEALDEPIARYGGEVDKFMGDAIMATFGVPVAHDDDPRRAVLAALEMQTVLRRLNQKLRKVLGSELEMRIGINTGVVLAGPIGSARKRARTVLGDAVNVAARLEHAAPIGGILIGEATRSKLGSAFRLRARRSVRIRGKEAPVRSYVVLGAALAHRERRLGSRCFGRELDLRRLRKALAPIRAGSQALVRLSGSMGVGKTRVIQELRARWTSRGQGWIGVSCPPYGQDLPYATLAALLRGLAVSLERRHGPTAVEDILAAAAAADGLDASLAASVVRTLLYGSVADDDAAGQLPAQLRKGLLARATKVLLRASASERAQLIALDDCHWLDAASATILTEATDDLRGVSLGWLLAARPEWQRPSAWAATELIELEPLPATTSAAMARALLGPRASNELISFVVERADGNPLFLVELSDAIAEAETLPVDPASLLSVAGTVAPATYLNDQLRSLILARIDSLDEQARRVVHIAAVLGYAFPASLLRRMLSHGDLAPVLARLEDHGLLQREARPRGDGTGSTWTWQFRHPLVQETVYASLLSATRTTLHRTAGHALELMSNAVVADRLALLALHFGRSDDRQRAVKYLCAAGDQARALYLNHEAIRYYDDALSRLGNSGEEQAMRATVLASKAAGLEVLAEDEAALDCLQAAIDLEQKPVPRSALQVRMAEIHRRRGVYALARENLVRAETTLRRRQDVLQHARVRISRAMLAMDCGAFDETRRLGEDALGLLAQREAHLEEAASWRAIGIAAARSNDLDAAHDALTRGHAAAQRASDRFTAATIAGNLGAVLQLQGRFADARELYQDSLAFYEGIGAKRQIASVCINLGDLAWRNGDGDWDTAHACWQRAAALCEEIGDKRNLAIAFSNLGEAHVRRGEMADGIPFLQRALALARELGNSMMVRDLERLVVTATAR